MHKTRTRSDNDFQPEDENQDAGLSAPPAAVAAMQIDGIAHIIETMPGHVWDAMRPTNGLATDEHYPERPRAARRIAAAIHARIFGDPS